MNQPVSRWLLVLAVTAPLPTGRAQQGAPSVVREAVIELGTQLEFRSSLYGATRRVRVGLPASYGVSAVSYPVLYLLDGDVHFDAAFGTVRHLHWADRMPEVIVVGVAPQNRSAEYVPPKEPTPDRATGADLHLQHLRTEVSPLIEARYRCAPHRVLIGHSLGGLTSVHAMLSAPETFQSYLALSPSLYWHDNAMQKRLERITKDGTSLPVNLFLNVGDQRERPQTVAAIDGFVTTLAKASATGIRSEFRRCMDCDHFDSHQLGLHRGLTWLFSGWRAWPIAHAGDWPRLERHFRELTERFGYDVPIPERMLNRVAYAMLQKGDTAAAVAACRRNAATYPRSANCHDSLGEALMAADEVAAAVAAFTRACELADETGDERLPAFREHLENARGRLRR